jgi:hypothetical protein
MKRITPLPTLDELRAMAAEFAAAFEPVLAVYVFGSVARGRTKAESDVDFGVWIEPGSGCDRFKLRLDAIGWFMDHLSGDNVDVIVINDAPPVLQYNVVCRGQLLFERSPGVRWQCWRRALNMYWDAKPMLDRGWRRTLAEIRKWRQND